MVKKGVDRTLANETVSKVGEKVKLYGWAEAIRDHGKITFIDLRDRSGKVQCVGSNLPKVTVESVLAIEGLIKNRPENLVNPNLETGEVEIQIEKLEIISRADELPLPIDSEGYDIEETVRNKYRYLDLRRPRMTTNIRIRSRVANFMRRWLIEKEDFIEIETPILTKTTPEGARDFLVPSRLQQGKFYALPQSPQQYKQLLMVAGFERYFQLARCFRDEDPRHDRAYGEFTQLDIEMSFVSQDDILQLTEKLFTELVKEIFPEKKITKTPWPRISHATAIEKYKSDKPDLRKDKKNKDELAFAWIIDFPLFVKQTKEDFYHGAGAKYAPSHHMFTAPHPDDITLLESDPLRVRGLQHDMVLNGYEVGGGSIRIHDPKIQAKVFELIGFSDAQKRQFEHMLTAFRYGVPPHGGIAPGVDRFTFVALGEPTIREVMAYPTTASGIIAVMDAPSEASDGQLSELSIKIVKK